MKRFIVITLLVLGFTVACPVLLASDISGARYSGTMRASNNSTAAAHVSVPFSINSTAWIDAEWLNATTTNAVVRNSTGADAGFMPGYNGDPWIVFFDSVPANASKNYYLYIDDVTGATPAYFPDSAGANTTDSASLELGDNFTIEQYGWINTDNASAKYLKYKPEAFALAISDNESGTINSIIFDSNDWVSPTAFNDPTTNWANETNVYDGDTGTNGTGNAATFSDWGSYLELSGFGTIWSDRVRVYVPAGGDTNTIGIDAYWDDGWHTIFEDTYTANDWTTCPYGAWHKVSQIRIRGDGTGGAAGGNWNLGELEIGTTTAQVSATGVDNGKHTITTWADSSDLHIAVDGVETDNVSLNGASVPNNSANITLDQNYAMPYLIYSKTWVGGTLQQHIIWQYATTFSDQSGNGHDAYPTFRTTSSDADVSGSLINFGPITLSSATDTVGTWPSLMTDAPDQPSTMYTENTTPGFFFSPMFTLVETYSNGNLPASMLYYLFCFTIILLAGVFTFFIIADKGKQSALLLKILVMTAFMVFFALPGLNVYGFYVCIYFIMWCFGIMVLSRSYGW